jgi:hypothetical protein
MTNNVLRCMRPCVLVAMGLVLAGLCHAQTFSFSVPATDPAIARVKITLEGAAAGTLTASGTNPAISGGASFNFLNTAAPHNPTFVAGEKASDPSNDFIRADAVGSDLVIQYIRNGHFNTTGTGGIDYCTGNGTSSAQAETITFTLSGATSTAYRKNSYTVPGTPGVPAVDCSKAKRRVSNGATWVTNPPGTDHGRHPLDVVLVLDVSGSMETQDFLPGSTKTRMDALRSGGGEFVDHFNQTDPFGYYGKDRIAVVTYSSSTVPASGAGINFVARGSGIANWDTLKTTQVTNLTSDGSTGMGPGIQVAIDGWFNHANANTDFDDAAIVLMTDGLQNIPPPPVKKCAGTQNEALLNLGCGAASPTCTDPDDAGTHLSELFQCGIPMETLSLGPTADSTLMDTIAQQTAGKSVTAVTTFGMETGLADSLVEILKGGTESLLFRAEDTLISGGGGAQLRSTLLDGSVERAIFVLGWQGIRTDGILDLEIYAPGCTPTTCKPVPPVIRADGPTWTVQSVDIPKSGAVGNWSVRVVQRQLLSAVVVGNNGVPYHLSGYSIEGRLSYRISVAGVGQGTGDSIGLEAQLSYDGKPLTGIGSAIKVHVERPDTGEGTYLHDTPVSNDVLNSEPDPNDTTTPFERKILYLAKNGNLKSVIQPKPLPTEYSMLDNGDAQNADHKANDGIYSAKLADTSRPGLYRFTVTMDWTNGTTGQIHRVETIERVVKVNPTPAGSEITVTKGTNPGEWLVGVTPRDSFGNYVGPGFTSDFQVQVSGGGSVTGAPLDAQQTGAYGVKLTGVPPGANPKVTISVGGKQIRSAPLSKLHCNPSKGCCRPSLPAAIFLFAGVFALGFVWAPSRRKNG